jgi:hypothetical protein
MTTFRRIGGCFLWGMVVGAFGLPVYGEPAKPHAAQAKVAKESSALGKPAEAEELVAVPIRKWKAIGPWGDPQLKNRPVEGHPQWNAHNFCSRIFEAAKYPVDTVVDLDA